MHSHARLILLPLGLLVATVAVAGQIATGCVFGFQDDCSSAFRCPPQKGATSGGGNGSASTSSSTSGMSGGGATTGCTDAAECQVPPGPCASLGTATCTKGICVVTYQAGLAPSQQYGDCAVSWCNDMGVEMQVPDAGNVFVNSADPCLTWPCTVGVTGMPPFPTTKQDNNCSRANTTTGYCEQDPFSMIYVCAECKPSDQTTCGTVPGTTCAGGTCVPSHCTDHVQNDGESDTDCGGGAQSGCLPCGYNKMCQSYKDCASLVCGADAGADGGRCQAPTCSDGQLNGTETDKDCGGQGCNPCVDGLFCFQPSDCISGVCVPNGTGSNICAAPTCTDGVQNGGETGVDCGGTDGTTVCPPCAKAADAGDASDAG